MNKIYVSFSTPVKDVELIKAFSNVNNKFFSDALLLGGEPDGSEYKITVRAKEPGYHWINFSFNLGTQGYVMEYVTSGDVFMAWLIDFFGNAVAELLNGKITNEDILEISTNPKIETFSDLLKDKNKNIYEFSYVIPPVIFQKLTQ